MNSNRTTTSLRKRSLVRLIRQIFPEDTIRRAFSIYPTTDLERRLLDFTKADLLALLVSKPEGQQALSEAERELFQVSDFDFNGHNTLYATHGLHPYAAKCPPQLVKYGLRHYSKPGEIVVDPMVGSGTTLVEARLMGRHAVGYDIDPLARLIAQVKSKGLDDASIVSAYEAVVERTARDLKALKSGEASTSLQEVAQPPDYKIYIIAL
mgnify:FL=1